MIKTILTIFGLSLLFTGNALAKNEDGKNPAFIFENDIVLKTCKSISKGAAQKQVLSHDEIHTDHEERMMIAKGICVKQFSNWATIQDDKIIVTFNMMDNICNDIDEEYNKIFSSLNKNRNNVLKYLCYEKSLVFSHVNIITM